MTVFGKQVSEYFAFCKTFFGLILAVGIVRLALSLGGASNPTVRWISITGVVWIAVLYLAVRVHTTGFGTYRHLLPIVVLLQSVAAQIVIVTGIVIAIFTGVDNIFSAPEYAFGADGKTWFHVGAHLLVGTTIGALVGWIVGCLIMFASKKLLTTNRNTSAGRAWTRSEL